MFDTTYISAYRNALSTTPQSVLLNDFLRSERTKDVVNLIRNEPDKAKRSDMKKLLPAATISGRFKDGQRKIAGIQEYNGLLCMDFDGSDNPGISPEQIKSILAEYQEISYAGLSVSGTGVFAIIPTNNEDPAEHPGIVDFMRNVFLETGLLIDGACKDVCRLRFISYDSAPWINRNAIPFDAKYFLKEQRSLIKKAIRTNMPIGQGDQVQTKVDRYIKAIEAAGRDITGNYDTWLRIGFALASEFGMRGEGYYQRVSQFHPKYDYSKTEKKYLELCRNGGNRIQIGTFFKFCHENGIKP